MAQENVEGVMKKVYDAAFEIRYNNQCDMWLNNFLDGFIENVYNDLVYGTTEMEVI